MIDFSPVTEVAGSRATREQLAMIQTRYAEGARRARDRRVLEVGCGAGRGLGLIERAARQAVGGDFTFSLLQRARAHYGARVPLAQFDAQALPFAAGAFDLVLLFEAIYYLPDAARFVRECRRVLAPGGELFICSANCDAPGFTGSSLATRYLAARDIRALLAAEGFETELKAAFPARRAGLAAHGVSALRRAAVALHVVPSTLRGREWLKRAFYGPLTRLAPEIGERDAPAAPLVPIDAAGADRPLREFRVIYAFGHLR
ncbi:MAG: class I SAM-dependent methyltransferase [Acidobacteria bacterium]|nr:class I SAM-dependent methyltransferase [Acidobacteriota bacterium]